MKLYTIAVGNPKDGFANFGLFDTFEQAHEWAAYRWPETDSWVMEVNEVEGWRQEP